MRLVCAAGTLFLGCLAYGQQVPAQRVAADPGPATSSIDGQVFNSATGAPLKKAAVSLNGLGMSAPGAMPVRYSKETDETGHFSFTALPAGRYTLSVTRLGFLRQGYGARKFSGGGTPFSLAADQHMKDVVFKLSPQSVIAGKVLDEDGDPVAN